MSPPLIPTIPWLCASEIEPVCFPIEGGSLAQRCDDPFAPLGRREHLAVHFSRSELNWV